MSPADPAGDAAPSTWLSVHLGFSGEVHGEVGDRLALEVVAPIVAACRGEVERWFFLRYGEDGSHLRLRLRAPADLVETSLWPRVAAAARASTLVEKAVRQAYEPELERYGGPWGVDLAEEVFQASSETALALLARIAPGQRPARLGKALLAMLVLLHVYRGDAAAAADFATRYGDGYLRAWAPDPQLQTRWRRGFEEGFDRQADRLVSYVEAAWEALTSGDALTPELDAYRDAMTALAQRLAALFADGYLLLGGEPAPSWDRAVRWIVPSYVHMTNNRLGVSLEEEVYLAVLIAKTLAPDAVGDDRPRGEPGPPEGAG